MSKKSSYECKHKWRRHSRDLDYCPKCKSYQLSMGLEVESVPKQKKTLQPNQIVPMLHQ
jgi:hypothetical protein